MPSRHFREWSAYYRLEPFGQWRDNWHAALVAAIMANANRDPKKPPMQMSEFMFEDPADARDRKDQEMLAWIESKVKH